MAVILYVPHDYALCNIGCWKDNFHIPKGKSSSIGDNEWMNLMPCKVCHFGEPYT